MIFLIILQVRPWPTLRLIQLALRNTMILMNDLEIILTIIGSGISVLLLINAHFTRKTLERITSVDLNLAVLITNHNHTDERARKNENRILYLENKVNRLEIELQAYKGE